MKRMETSPFSVNMDGVVSDQVYQPLAAGGRIAVDSGGNLSAENRQPHRQAPLLRAIACIRATIPVRSSAISYSVD